MDNRSVWGVTIAVTPPVGGGDSDGLPQPFTDNFIIIASSAENAMAAALAEGATTYENYGLRVVQLKEVYKDLLWGE